MRAPERLAQTVLVVSLTLATSTPLVWTLLTPPANTGTLPTPAVTASPLPTTTAAGRQDAAAPKPDATNRQGGSTAEAEAAAAPKPDATRRQGGSTAEAEAAPRPATRSARIADLDATPNPTPTRLRIPSIDVDAKIDAIGVEDNGDMQVPDNVGDVGWYRHGPAPNQPGATVIAGHVDSRQQGPGAFFDLRTLNVDARVTVTDTTGDTHHYDVVARRTYDKTILPTDKLFSRIGPTQLVLITCGGTFNNTTRSYQNNTVIYAQPS